MSRFRYASIMRGKSIAYGEGAILMGCGWTPDVNVLNVYSCPERNGLECTHYRSGWIWRMAIEDDRVVGEPDQQKEFHA